MNMIPKIKILLRSALVSCLIIAGCSGDNLSKSTAMPLFSKTLNQTITPDLSVTGAITTISVLENKNFIITPEDIFSTRGLGVVNTPNSTDFCAHIPSPEISQLSDKSGVLSGIFSLCVSRNWDVAFDLDTGSFVTEEDPQGDIQLLRDKAALASDSFYYLYGVNGALIEETGMGTAITYKSCESMSLATIPPVVFFIKTEGAIACVMTTNNQVALIRVEHIYPQETDSIEFSFVILRKK